MDSKRILKFLRQVMANNNRPWFQEHKPEYEIVRAEFERGIVLIASLLWSIKEVFGHARYIHPRGDG